MAIQKRPAKPAATISADDFINQAPDAQPVQAAPSAPAKKRTKQGNQVQLSVAMTEELLDKVEAAAKAMSVTRTAYIKMVLAKAVQA